MGDLGSGLAAENLKAQLDGQSVPVVYDPASGLLKVDLSNAHAGPPDLPPSSQLRTELVMPPRDAYFAPGEHIPIEESSGRIAAEKVTPYPPGVPVLVPGELITKPIIEYLRKGVEIGMNVTDVADSDLETIRVVAA